MLKVKEVIVVEGTYDKNTLSQTVEATIIVTDGFGLFKDSAKMELLRRAAERRGLIVFTDSDGAGFVIRIRIKSSIPEKYLKHAYIPDIYGKEKRKRRSTGEGKLGVEGMTRDILIKSLERAGATFEDAAAPKEKHKEITKSDLMMLGLTGRSNSRERREKLLDKLQLPRHMSVTALLDALNIMYDGKESLNDLVE